MFSFNGDGEPTRLYALNEVYNLGVSEAHIRRALISPNEFIEIDEPRENPLNAEPETKSRSDADGRPEFNWENGKFELYLREWPLPDSNDIDGN